MFANFRIYWILVMVILIVCLKSELNATNKFSKTRNTKSTQPVDFALPSSNPSVCGINFPIFDNSCTASHRYDILVSGVSPNQLGTNVILQEVRIIIAHTWDNDLDITLESPNNVVIELSTDNGAGADNYGDPTDVTCSNYTTFSMSGCQSIIDGEAPFIGTYVPEGDFNDFYDGSDPNGIWTLQMCDDASSDVGALMFVELVFTAALCDAPTNLTLESFDSTAAQISWISDDCANTIIEYGSPGFAPGNSAAAGEGTVISASCPVLQPFMLNNLEPETEYEIYVRNECTSGGFTQNSCSISFKTDCTTPPLTLSENFDAQTACNASCSSDCEISGLWSNSHDDDFDWLIDAGGTTSANTGPSDDITGGGNYIYIETSGIACQGENQADLISNCLLIGAATESCHLSFYYHMFGAGINELHFDISTNDGLNWTNLWSLYGDQGDHWEKVFVDLGAFDNEIAILRFSAIGGTSFRGDIAIDNIQFYGTTAIGDPSNTYFLDNDGDGYGDLNFPLEACSIVPPPNYVENAEDCDDNNDLIYPNAFEIPCNLIDENCNGMADDGILADPIISNTEACFGTSTVLSGSGNLFWYDALEGGNLLFSGNDFNAGILMEDTVFYVIDSIDISCKSQRIAVNVTMNPNPDIFSTDTPEICAGAGFDLSTLNIVDLNNTGGNLTFHSESPANGSNELTSSIVYPFTTQTYYILSTSAFGCTDELEVIVLVNAAPEVVINPGDTSRICKNGSQILTSSYVGGGVAPFTYEWSNGSNNTLTAYSSGIAGTVETVWLSVTDSIGCSHVDTVFIETVESITSAATSTSDVTVCGGIDGTISVTPIDGIPPYQISWEGPVNGSVLGINGSYDIQNLEQGAYSIHISDSDPNGIGCQMTIPIVIVNGPSATVDTNIVITNASCVGLSDGAIDISVVGNNPTYLWSNGAVTQDVSDISAGFYNVTITDGNCTNILTDIEVEQPDTFAFSTFINEVSCYGFDDGAIEILISGGVSPYSINWNNGQTGELNSDLTSGDYSFSLTDANGCVFNSNTITVNEPQNLEFVITDSVPPSCFGESDGSLDISISGGTGPYEFLWSNGAVTEDIYQLGSGTYEVTVNDSRGCILESGSIILTEPSILSYTILTAQVPSCNNLSNGLIEIEIAGGTTPYQYNWSNGATEEDINNLEEGIYTLTITDSQNCELVSNSIELVAPAIMSINLNDIQNAFCDGVADGAIGITVNGGTGPYSFLWSNDEITEDLDNLVAGDYQLTVTDFNGCTMESTNFTITENTSFNAVIDQINNVNCHSNANGSIYLSTSGGLAPYTFNWNSGAVTEDIENLIPGNYFATIEDDNGCLSYTDTIVIAEPESLIVDIVSAENPVCNGFENGSIDAFVSGGIAPYFYSWNNGASNEDLSNVPSGTYQLTVQDNNDCVASSDLIVLNEPDLIEIIVEDVVHVGCSGVNEGSIEITVEGGSPPFEYTWNTGDFSQNIFGLSTGFYAVTVADNNGCKAILSSIEVEQLNDGFTVEPSIINHVSCHESSDGILSISMLGGTPPYQFNWSNGAITEINSNLQGGIYDVTVTDANGCVGISSFIEIFEPNELQFLLSGIGHNECFGSNEGFLEIGITGGISPYSFLWSNGDTTQNISNLEAGNYSVTITDANGCLVENNNSFVIEGQTSNISVSVVSQNDVLCYGLQNGSISLSVTGGVAPYNYEWNNGDSTATINQLSGGTYICEVSDANNCVVEEISVDILEPEAPISLDSVTIVDNINCNDSIGSITLYLSGGTPGYHFVWNTGDTTSVIENLDEGFYECTITDENGCFYNTEGFFILSPLDDITLETSSTPETIGFSDGTATVTPEGGNPPFTYLWDDNAASQTDSIAINLSTGNYEVTVTDARGCTAVISVEVGFFTDIENIDIIENFRLFPNPTNASTKLEMDFSKAVDIKIELYSMIGNKVYEIEKNATLVNEYLDLSNYSSGVYLLRITIDNNRTLTRKVILSP